MRHSFFTRRIALALASSLTFLPCTRGQEVTSQNNERLRNALKQYPEADTNKDGVLSMVEGLALLAKIKGGQSSGASAADLAKNPPTFADVAYGPHERNKLDFWKAASDKPAPVIVFIHGGGFVSGDKSKARGDRTLTDALAAKVNFTAINYRYRTGIPLQDVLRDCARAIQFIRSKAGEWNVDKKRIASYGGSAGAGTSLWLAFHDDLADPQNSDPVLRESTRLIAAGANATQFSYDITRWKELFSEDNKKFGDPEASWPAFYGLKSLDELNGPIGQKWRADCDMHGLISSDDPPVFLSTTHPGGDIRDRGHLLHHPLHAKAVLDKCRECGVPAEASLPGLGIQPSGNARQTMSAFLLQRVLTLEEPVAAPAGS